MPYVDRHARWFLARRQRPLIAGGQLARIDFHHRAFVFQTVVALVVVPLSYLLSNPQENVNWVYGFGQNPQKMLPAPLFMILLMLLFPLIVYLPSHLLFTTMFRERVP